MNCIQSHSRKYLKAQEKEEELSNFFPLLNTTLIIRKITQMKRITFILKPLKPLVVKQRLKLIQSSFTISRMSNTLVIWPLVHVIILSLLSTILVQLIFGWTPSIVEMLVALATNNMILKNLEITKTLDSLLTYNSVLVNWLVKWLKILFISVILKSKTKLSLKSMNKEVMSSLSLTLMVLLVWLSPPWLLTTRTPFSIV